MVRRVSLINKFLDEIKNLSREEMLERSKIEKEKVQNEVKENRHANETDFFQDLLRYYVGLKGLVYFLEYEERHETIPPKVFRRFEWIATKLIQKGEMDKKVLILFIYS
jgi:hypothetical protein